MPCTNKPPCRSGYVKYRLASGKMCCRKARKGSTVPRTSKPVPRTSKPVPRTSKPVRSTSSVNLANAKKILRENYSMIVNGKARAPPFITNLVGVTGNGTAEKIANLRRTLSTCKKMGIPLMRSDGKKFKTYRTLVSQCGVTFTRTPKGMRNSNLVAKWRARRNSAVPEGYQPLASGPAAPLPDFIDLSSLGTDEVGQYVPPPLVMFGARRSKYSNMMMEFGKKRRTRKGPRKVKKLSKRAKALRKYKSAAKKAGYSVSGDEDLGSYGDAAGISFFGKKRRSRKGSRKSSSKVKKVPKKMLKLAKKLKIKVTVKRGSKRVPKKLSLLKKQIKMKLRAMKRTRR